MLLVALGVDNFGSGLFLPLPVLYATRVVGLPVGVAGVVITIGTAVGFLVPPLAGRLVDRVGPRVVVIASQLGQAAGAFAYLVADGVAVLLVAAVLLAAGQQAFYSSLFALIADTAGQGPKDKPFAVVAMVRAACFGLGGLVVSVALAGAGPAGLRIAVAADAVSFLVAAALLAFWLRVPVVRHPAPPASAGVLRNRPYLSLIVVTAVFSVGVDFFLVAIPVYVLEILAGPAWLPGAMLALLTAARSVAGTAVLHWTRRLTRTASMVWGAAGYVVWCLMSLAAMLVPAGWLPAFLLLTVVPIAAANLVSARANALAEAAAPPALRGRYLAAFQYAFTAAGVAAPGVVALFALGGWVPWLVVAACSAVAGVALPVLARHLPRDAVAGN
ncbi:MFS transporter [Actinophytocola sp.]|uniref:MFS transporter n=1 Tax=Actinophytocola sp. TaxID=1872138 RepID=UPI002EDBB67B